LKVDDKVLNLNAGKAYLVESIFFTASRVTGIEPPLLLAGRWRVFYWDPATYYE
jgi:hypothetical protein